MMNAVGMETYMMNPHQSSAPSTSIGQPPLDNKIIQVLFDKTSTGTNVNPIIAGSKSLNEVSAGHPNSHK